MELPIGVAAIRLRSEVDEASLRQSVVERLEIFVTRELYLRPVIETGASQRAIVHAKARDADDVKRHVSGSAQPSDVAGVRRNLRFDERDGEHEE